MSETLRERIEMALEELADHIAQQDWSREELGVFLDEPGDEIHEIADGCVPVMNHAILEIAASDHNVSLREPEIGPAFDGTPTPVNIAAANIFELIEEALWEDVRRRQDELEDTEV